MIYRISKKLLLLLVTICCFASCEKEATDEYEAIYNVNFTNMADPSFHIRLTPEVLYVYWDGRIDNVFFYTLKDGVIITDPSGNDDYIALKVDLNAKELSVLDTNMIWLQGVVFKQ